MPNRENIRKWVDALRSGEFKQAEGALRRADSHCCLGVACELYHREVGGRWSMEDGEWWFVADGDENESVLPEPVRDWLGLSSCNPGTGEVPSLAERNDMGAPFSKIADLIEREWLTEGED